MNIIAMDLGKFNSMFCFNDTATQDYGTAPAATERKYFEKCPQKPKTRPRSRGSVCSIGLGERSV